jgi:hypothetical protein
VPDTVPLKVALCLVYEPLVTQRGQQVTCDGRCFIDNRARYIDTVYYPIGDINERSQILREVRRDNVCPLKLVDVA